MDMNNFEFDFTSNVQNIQKIFENSYNQLIREYRKKNLDKGTLDMASHAAYQYSRMAIEVCSNLLKEYDTQLKKYLTSIE